MPSLSGMITLISLSLIMLSACNSAPQQKVENQSADSISHKTNIETPAIEKKDSIVLKNISLNEKAVMGNRLLAKAELLREDSLVKMSVATIDSVPDRKGFRYHLLDTLFFGKEIKVVLIGREYTEENIIWMAVYNKNNNLLESKELYYDNSEGFRSVNTEIKNNLIIVNTNNDYAETTAEQKMRQLYFIDGNYKLSRKL